MLLAVVLGLLFNNVIYQHRHKMSDGTYIVHAHPFSNPQDASPLKKHKHTKEELQVISAVNNLLFSVLLLVAFLLLQLLRQVDKKLIVRTVSKNSGKHYFFYNLRAPPAI